MSGLEDLLSQIPTSDIASKLGVDEGEVNKAVQLLVPVLVGGLQENAQDPDHAEQYRVRGRQPRRQRPARRRREPRPRQRGGRPAGHREDLRRQRRRPGRRALAGGGGGNSDLLKQLLPILAPIVLAYIGKQLARRSGAGQARRLPRRRRAQRRAGQHPRRSGAVGQQVAGHGVGQRAGGGSAAGRRHSRRTVRRRSSASLLTARAGGVRRGRRCFLDLTCDREPRTRR